MIERILFAVVFGIIVVGLSLFSGKIFSIGFHLSKISQSKVLLVAVLLPLIYITNFIVIRSSSTGIASILYGAFNIVGGLVFYLFIGAGVLSLVLMYGFVTGTHIPSSVSIVILAISLLLGIVGFIQAKIIRITHYEVPLAGAPSSWDGKRAVLVSDTHFSPINRRRFSEKVVRAIMAQSPDFVLHAGDFYDGPMIPLVPITTPWKKLSQAVPLLYAPGNHEGYGDYDTFISSIKDTGAIVLEDKMTVYDGVQIAGLRYQAQGQGEKVEAVIKEMKLDTRIPTILINHPPTFQKEVSGGGISLMVSGHTHNGQFWPLNYIVRSIYGKYIYGMQTDGPLTTITTSGVGTFGPPLRLFNPPEIVVLTFKAK